MKIEEFSMERMQSTWENIVSYNLSESGVHPVELQELLSDPADRESFVQIGLGYSQSNGSSELRRLIAAMYSGASEENVLVTTGTSEANFIVTWLLTELGDEAVVMVPNYMQVWGLARGFGAEVKPFDLEEDRSWSPELGQLDKSVSKKTKLIAVCNPNNPTGAILTELEMNHIVDVARSVDAWLLVDEVYRGAELNRQLTPTFWGRYDKLILTSGLSKAFGLPGLRIGWIVSTPDFIGRAWSYHDYTTICPSPLADFLARIALRRENIDRFLERTRTILNSNYPILKQWVGSHDGLFSVVDPRAGAIAYLRYNLEIRSLDLINRLRDEKSVLIVAGEQFMMGKYLRIGYGGTQDHLKSGLALLDELLGELI